MRDQIPVDSWQLYLETVKKATKNIDEILAGRPMGPLLSQFLHLLAFQQGVCVARWVNNNRDLVGRLNEIQSFTKEEFDQIASEVRRSVEKMFGF
ncbi:MAG: hypothetical protein A2W25_06885 [candidate division Zixibacteria bacterium RBG_16_53_22]|nr:MAG: hypothetical protein A2W25_06885 [candidate division Zixibacteria bacterium RBG_16_53_22]